MWIRFFEKQNQFAKFHKLIYKEYINNKTFMNNTTYFNNCVPEWVHNIIAERTSIFGTILQKKINKVQDSNT